MPRFHLPLTIDLSVRTNQTNSALDKGAYVQNGYFKHDTNHKLYNRPGLREYQNSFWDTHQVVAMIDATTFITFNTSTNATDVYTCANYAATPSLVVNIYAAGSITYSNCSVCPTTVTTLPAHFIHFQNVSGSSTHAFTLITGTSTLASITDADFPSTTRPGCAFLDTYNFVMKASATYAIYNSDTAAPTSWNALGYIEPNLNGGTGVGIESYKNHILFMGSHNIQFFYDAAGAAPGSPLLPRQDLVFNFGVHENTTYSLKKTWWKSEVGDILAFIGRTFDGKRFIGMFDGFTVNRVSNDFVDTLLNNQQDLFISGYYYDGKTFLHVTLGYSNTGLSLYYDTETKIWHPFSTSLTNLTNNVPIVDYKVNDTTLDGYQVLLTNSGKLFNFNSPMGSHQDTEKDGATHRSISLVVQFPRYRGEPGYESRRKFQHEFQLIADTQTSSDTMSVQYSDDDYQTFSTARTIDMANTLKQLQQLGVFRERVFKLTYTGTNQVRWEAIEGQIRMGMN